MKARGLLLPPGRGAVLPCFFCGLDSWALLVFLVCVFGVAQLGTFFFLAWSVARGDFRDTERVKFGVLDAEDRETAEPPKAPQRRDRE